eukprot:gene12946-23906_t
MCNMYMYISDAMYIQICGFLDYYYTAGPGCVEDGPNFSYTYGGQWLPGSARCWFEQWP